MVYLALPINSMVIFHGELLNNQIVSFDGSFDGVYGSNTLYMPHLTGISNQVGVCPLSCKYYKCSIQILVKSCDWRIIPEIVSGVLYPGCVFVMKKTL